jgi:3',5'-cyclic AMP phosphodiesterase CpdA
VTTAAALVGELEIRIGLSRGTPTLLLIIVADDQSLTETARCLSAVLGHSALKVVSIEGAAAKEGPARWADESRRATADAYLVAVAPVGPLSARIAAKLFNAQRQNLRDLAGPLLLLLSNKDEAQIRETAPDFFSWVAQSYEAPSLDALLAFGVERGAVAPASERPSERPIRFLHLSDLHLRPAPGRRYDQGRVLKGLLALLARDRAEFPLDLIFITGDIAFSGAADDYAVVAPFLADLLDATGVPPAHLFVVPGNHDVDRGTSQWLLRTLASDDAATAFFVDSANRRWHAHKFDAYRAAMSQVAGATRGLGLGVGAEAVEIVTVRGQAIAIASFNSAWFAHDDADTGKLWLGEASVDQAVDRIQHEAPVALTIALMHHPTESLSELEREPVERLLERSFDVVLRGHLHREKTRVFSGQRGSYLEIAGPAAYQGSQWPNGCFLGELSPAARTVRLRPYTFSSGADPWVLDARVFPDDEKHGYRHTFHLGPSRASKLGQRSEQKKALEAMLESAPTEELKLASATIGIAPAPREASQERAAAALKRRADPEDLLAFLHQQEQKKPR